MTDSGAGRKRTRYVLAASSTFRICLFNLSMPNETVAWVVINLPKVKQQILNHRTNHAKASACSL